jgi:hypothetical protein
MTLTTKYMEQSPSEVNRQQVKKWNLKVHYRAHKSLVLDPILSQINPVHILTLYFLKIHLILSSHLRRGL